jgi:hydroxymethylglutaryl-CoA lyase
MEPKIHITETPRDAMQAWPVHIPAEQKARYINKLLNCGFDNVDCGSFVSPKAIPQMADTKEVISLLEPLNDETKIMVLVGNLRGGLQASAESKVNTIAFPYSVSATFLKKNLNTTPEAAWETILDLKGVCAKSGKELRVYLTMAFGNPYGDDINDEIVKQDVEKFYNEGIRDLVFSDITGHAVPGNVERLCSELIQSFHGANFGIHLHAKPNDWQDKIEAAWRAGIRNFESVLGGFGGCPMTGYELLGNLDTQNLVDWCKQNHISHNLNESALNEAKLIINEVFKH